MSKEASRPSLKEFYQAVGTDRLDAEEIRDYLDQRLIRTLEKFPFSPEGTYDLPILRIEWPKSESDEMVFLPGFQKPLSPLSLEKIMDNVIISRSKFYERYTHGPVKKIRYLSKAEEGQMIHKTIEFIVPLEGGMAYRVSKEIDSVSFINEKGKLTEKKQSVQYTASLIEDDLYDSLIMEEVRDFLNLPEE